MLECQRRLLRRAQPALLQSPCVHLLQAQEALPRVAVRLFHMILAMLEFVLGESLAQWYARLRVPLFGVENLRTEPA